MARDLPDLAQLSIREIHSRFVQGDAPVTGAVLSALGRDPRAGVRQVHATLLRRRERETQERARIDSMLVLERQLWESGIGRIAGVDEAGVGPLAGPVVAAAVVFAPGVRIDGVDDSKKIDPARRERLADEVRDRALDWAVGQAEVEEIDRLNVYHAAILAMRRAVEGLSDRPEHVLLDAREIPDLGIPQDPIVKGDGRSVSIAAASILAKTHRDALMHRLDDEYPEYGFARHKGYGTEEHQAALREHGPCAVHRMSYQAIHELCGELSDRFYRLRDELSAITTESDLSTFEDALPGHRDALTDGEHKKLRLLLTRRRNRA